MRFERILMLSLARHDDHTTSTTFQLAKCFQKENDVLIVEHPYTITELIKNLFSKKGWVRLRATLSWKFFFRKRDGITVLVPPVTLPINFLSKGKRYDALSKINHSIIAKKINRFLKAEQWGTFDYINSYNYHFPKLDEFLKGTLNKRVYHCVDPMVKAYTLKHGVRNEKIAIMRSDFVVNTAPSLQEKWQQMKPSYLIPNAVDYNHFVRPLQVVDRVRTKGNKLIGYFGNIERRIDYDLLADTFKQNPNWQLILAGPVDQNYVTEEVKALKNVHFIGPYTYEELPHLIHSVDATLIPFQCDEVSKGIYPLKLYEYLSIGKPVVSTLFNPDILQPLINEVYLSSETESLSSAIQKALNEKNNEIVQRRKRIASQNTWEERANLFLQLLTRDDHDKCNKEQIKDIPGDTSGAEETFFEVAI